MKTNDFENQNTNLPEDREPQEKPLFENPADLENSQAPQGVPEADTFKGDCEPLMTPEGTAGFNPGCDITAEEAPGEPVQPPAEELPRTFNGASSQTSADAPSEAPDAPVETFTDAPAQTFADESPTPADYAPAQTSAPYSGDNANTNNVVVGDIPGYTPEDSINNISSEAPETDAADNYNPYGWDPYTGKPLGPPAAPQQTAPLQPPYGVQGTPAGPYNQGYGQPYGQMPPQGSYYPGFQQPYGPYNNPYGGFRPTRPPANQLQHPGTSVSGMLPPKAPPVPVKNKGLRVFAFILAFIILATGAATAGYFLRGDDTLGTTSAPVNDPVNNGDGLVLNDKNEDEDSLSTNAVAKKLLPSVVGIIVYSMDKDSNAGSEATGIVVSKDGYILTNDHIYSGVPNAKFLIIMSDKTEYDAKFIAGDSRSDLAVLKIDGVNKLTPAEFGKSDELTVGENVIAIGNPYGVAYAGTVTKGIVSAVNRRVTGDSGSYSMKCIQTDTAINPGNSGGPLINMHGQVIGVNSSKIVATGYEGIGFAIPSATAQSVFNSLVAHGHITNRSKLGISYQTINSVLAKQNDLPTGLHIAAITEESDMNGKGVAVKDIITHVNDTEIKTGEEILDVIEETKPGKTIKLTIYHNATKQSSSVIVKLLADEGSSSYTTKVESQSNSNNPFEE